MHTKAEVADNVQKKPEMILYYNKYKTGVDCMDQMLGKYTTHRRTNRWPLAFFSTWLILLLLLLINCIMQTTK